MSFVCGQAASSLAVQVAVGDDRSVAREAQLPAMRVPSEHEVSTVVHECIEHTAVGRMNHPNRKVCIRIEGTGDILISIAADVRIVHTAKFECPAIGLHCRRLIGQVLPAQICQAVDEVPPGEHRTHRLPLRGALEVGEGIQGSWSEVVVAAQHECTRQISEGIQAVQHVRDRVEVCQEVACDDHEVGIQVTQRLQPQVLLGLAGHEVHVRDVQDPQIWLPQGKHGDLCSANREVLGLPVGVGQARSTDCRGADDGFAKSHGSMVTPQACPQQLRVGHNASMTALKAQLQANLTTAMKSRDQLTASTLRMALTAITNEEVAGKEARVLSDDEVLTVLGKEAKKRREAAEAYDAAQRPDLAGKEREELAVLEAYLPEGLSAQEVQAIIAAAVEEVGDQGLAGGAAMGAVMKIVQPQVRGRADGAAVAASVKSALGVG